MPEITIQSVAFPDVFLRMDGSGVTSFSATGGGIVNCQYAAGSWEQFQIIEQENGTINIASVAFPDVFLRMDGSGVTSSSATGGGIVNCQYTAGPWETFTLVQESDGSVNIASAAFPNVFLRMDGSGVTSSSGSGGGIVNCQYTAGPWERFFITAIKKK
jgi:phospholipase C